MDKALPLKDKDTVPGQAKLLAKGKALMKRTRPKISKEVVDNSTDDKGKGEDSSDGGVIHVKPKLVDKELVKCLSCKKDGSPCHVNPLALSKVSPTCYKCFIAKWKCSLYKRLVAEGCIKWPVVLLPTMPGEHPGKWSFWTYTYLRLTFYQ